MVTSENEDGPVYYEKINDGVYILWYGTTLGESNIYNSKKQRWES